MAELNDYERHGDPNAPFALTKKHEQNQQKAVALRAAVRSPVPPLTWDDYAAGDPCPGCGLPYRDGERWEFRGTMHFTEDERVRYDAEESRFKEAHGDCRASRHSVLGSLTMHCGKCCPVPPLSPGQRAEIGRILGRPTPPYELMRWRLRLYCGHVIDKRSHYKNLTIQSAFRGSMSCDQCGLDPATIVDGEAIGLSEPAPDGDRQTVVRETTAARKPTRAQLESKVRKLEAEIERLRGS